MTDSEVAVCFCISCDMIYICVIAALVLYLNEP